MGPFGLLYCCLPALPCSAVGTYSDLRKAIRERDLAVLAVHGRTGWNPAAPATLLPASSYSDQEVQATAAELHEKVGGARFGSLLSLEACAGCDLNWHACACALYRHEHVVYLQTNAEERLQSLPYEHRRGDTSRLVAHACPERMTVAHALALLVVVRDSARAVQTQGGRACPHETPPHLARLRWPGSSSCWAD
jgi:hypothetical protein